MVYITYSMHKRKIIIIGGGISGLTAGIHAIKRGFEPLILEKNPIPGGLCTGWKRKGFSVDGCIHWITGTKPGTQLYKMWQEIGAFKDEEIFYLPSWGSVDYQGVEVPFYSDLDKAEEAWKKISPSDKKQIHKFFKMVRVYQKVELPTEAPKQYLSLKTLFYKLVRYFPTYEIGLFMSCKKYGKKFKHPALEYAINHIQPGKGNLYSMVFSYANVAGRNGGIIKNGSPQFVKNILKRYQELGGEIIFNAPVKSVNISHHKATGVTLEDGRVIDGYYVVSCCDANYALIHLLNGKFPVRKIAKRYNKPVKHPAPSCILLHFAIEDIRELPIPYDFDIEHFSIGGYEVQHINLRNMGYDPMFVKGNKTVVQVLIDQYSKHYSYWENLYKNPVKYQEVKDTIAKMVMANIEKKFPETVGKIELLDVATPVTFNRYVNASRGSYMGFLYTNKSSALMISGKVPFLKRFYLSGQYVQCPGGLPLALCAGAYTIKMIHQAESRAYIFRYLIDKVKVNN